MGQKPGIRTLDEQRDHAIKCLENDNLKLKQKIARLERAVQVKKFQDSVSCKNDVS